MKYNNPYEKLTLTVKLMAGSPDTLQKRVADAYIYHLMYLKVEELPEEIRYRFENLCIRLTSKGSVYEATETMDIDEAIDMAREILYMDDIVKSRHLED